MAAKKTSSQHQTPFIANPLDSPVDHVRIAGKDSPGLATVKGVVDFRRWDVINGRGETGGRLIYTGSPPQHFSVEIRLYNTDNWNDWRFFSKDIFARPKLQPPTPPGTAPPRVHALDFYHPFTAAVGISAVVIEAIEGPVDEDYGVFCFTLKLIEYRKAAPGFSQPDGAKKTPKSTDDPWDKKIEQLTSQWQELAK